MEYILDIQGFRRSSNLFVLKEAALVKVSVDSVPLALYFEAPCKWSRLLKDEQEVNRWLETSFHGIPWNSGTIPYRQLIKVLQETLKDAVKIYVKGMEKKKWIEDIVPGKYVCNLEDIGCPSMKKLKKKNVLTCGFHPLRRDPVCAVRNATILKKWLLENEDGVDEVDSSQWQTSPLSQNREAEWRSMYN